MKFIDGVNCINVYYRGQTELGRKLSNLAHTPFSCIDGRFESVEGYWYWLSTHDDRLRSLWGYEAKKVGRNIQARRRVVDPFFEHKIRSAIQAKIIENHLYDAIRASTLPFVHFYVYPGHIIMKDDGSGKYKGIQLMQYFEKLRKQLKSIQPG